MAFDTIDLMPSLEWEKSVFKTLTRTVPLFANHIVATTAIGSETCRLMVGIGSCQIFVAVTTVAFGADYIIPLMGGRNVTSLAIGRCMGTNQWETTLAMDFLYFGILDQPRFGRMTTRAIVANRLLVYIFVTFRTFCRCIRKYKRRMTITATKSFVLPNQREFRRVMIEFFWFYIVPIFRRVTITALQLEIFAMRRLHGIAAKCQNQNGQE